MSAVSRFDLVATKVFAGLVAALAVAVPVWLVGLWATGQPLPWTSCTIADGPQYSAQAHYLGELEWRIADASTGQWLGVIGVATIGAASVLVGAAAIWRMATLVRAGRHFSDEFVAALRWLAGAVSAFCLVDVFGPPLLTMTVMGTLWEARQALWTFSLPDLAGMGIAVLLVLMAQLWAGAVAAARDAEGLI